MPARVRADGLTGEDQPHYGSRVDRTPQRRFHESTRARLRAVPLELQAVARRSVVVRTRSRRAP